VVTRGKLKTGGPTISQLPGPDRRHRRSLRQKSQSELNMGSFVKPRRCQGEVKPWMTLELASRRTSKAMAGNKPNPTWVYPLMGVWYWSIGGWLCYGCSIERLFEGADLLTAMQMPFTSPDLADLRCAG
jgi:hypothetical protein